MSFDEQWAREQWADWTGYSQESVGSAVIALAREADKRARMEVLNGLIPVNEASPTGDYKTLFREYAGLAMQAEMVWNLICIMKGHPSLVHAASADAERAVIAARALVEAVRKEEANAG